MREIYLKMSKDQLKVLLLAILTSCLLWGGNSSLLAQSNMTIKGKVKDESGLTVVGASVVVEGTTQGTITDIDGNFVLSGVPSDANLVISFIGLKTEIVPVQGRMTINVTLKAESIGLDEIVAVGYGVQKKSDVTGAMTRVSTKELNVRPVSNALEAIQGQAAGVDITSSERPGELGSITIRGVRSLNATSDPLYVVDGIPLMSSSAIETLNPRDIESIDILKDASATAIYGSRGANGVIIVTTKKGKEGKFTINYTGTYTVENIHSMNPMMNADEYITWRRWAWHNLDPDSYAPGDQPTLENDEKIFYTSLGDEYAWANIQKGWAGGTWDGSKVASTDWTDYVTQNAITHEHTVSASGGTDKMNGYASFGYLDQQGTQIGQWYKRYTSKASVDLTPKEWFKLGASINASWSEQDYGMSTLGSSSSSNPNSIYGAAEKIFSYAVPYTDEGEIILNPGGEENVFTIIGEKGLSTQQRQTFRALGSFYATVDLGEIFKPLNGLQFRTNFGPDFRYWREGVYIDETSVVRASNTGTSYARLKNQRDFSYTLDNLITYNKTIGAHNLGVTALHTCSQWNIESSSLSGSNIPKDSYLWNNFGSLDVTDATYNVYIGSGITEKQLESYMGRLNYNFNDKYLITASGRWDGASQLAAGHKWAFFPSAALGWRMSQEPFMENISWIDQLKLRFGAGTTGNSGIGAYSTKGAISDFFVPFGGVSNEMAYSINNSSMSKAGNELANYDLTWEETTQYNVGLDFSFLNGRIGGTLDVYKSVTDNLIMNVKIPVINGYKSTYANVGGTTNRGFDLSLSTVNIKAGAFQWRSNINLAYTKDRIERLAYGKNDMIDNGWFIGEQMSVIFAVEGDGLWQEEDAEEMAKWDPSYGFEPGKAKPVDQDGDYDIDEDDKVIIGNKRPNWTVGFNNTFEYKNWSLNVVTFGRLGYKMTGGNSQTGRYNQRQLDYWTPTNTDAEWQKPIYNEAGGDSYYSVIGFRDGGFIKLRTISLGYDVPTKFLSKYKIGNLRLYAQMKNVGMLYSTVDFKDLDTGSTNFNRGFVFGVNVDF